MKPTAGIHLAETHRAETNWAEPDIAKMQDSTTRIWCLFLLTVACALFLAILGFWPIDTLLEKELEVRVFCERQRELCLLIAFAIYTLLCTLPIPIAAIASVVCGWLFGFRLGVPLVSLASTSGATLTFLACRHYLRDWIGVRFAIVLKKINEAMRRDGMFYVVLLRLLPGIPFFVVNASLGVTSLSPTSFFALSLVGMLPGTLAFVYLGSQLPTLRAVQENGISAAMDWKLNLLLVGMVVVPWMVRFLFRKPI